MKKANRRKNNYQKKNFNLKLNKELQKTAHINKKFNEKFNFRNELKSLNE